MRCIAHIWRSIDCDGNQFLLCLSPLNSLAGGAPVEAFKTVKSLTKRLAEMGVESPTLQESMAALSDSGRMAWISIEMNPGMFHGFGRGPN